MRDGYHARWRGREYEVSPDGADMRLYATEAQEGFAQVRPGRFVRVVEAGSFAVGDPIVSEPPR